MCHVCIECGCTEVRARGHRTTIDPRGVVFPFAVDAVECADCGRAYAKAEIWEHRAFLRARPTARLERMPSG
jgi:hypothetical protein